MGGTARPTGIHRSGSRTGRAPKIPTERGKGNSYAKGLQAWQDIKWG